MIGKQDILDRATEWQLRPEVVEKDYILGWVLAALASHPETRARWILKGGTRLLQHWGLHKARDRVEYLPRRDDRSVHKPWRCFHAPIG